jgi:hypothetical protein
MTEDDRFGDLGPSGEERRAAIGERLAERDRTHPEPGGQRPSRPDVPRPGNKYAWVVGIVLLMGIGVLLWRNSLPNSGAGVEGPREGSALPAFAAPLATGNLDGEANVCQRRPCPRGTGRVPACEVRGEGVVNLCELRRRPLVLTFVVTRGADCPPQVDRVERIRPAYPRANFAVVMSGNSRAEAARQARRRGWNQPVAVDRDGGLVNAYGVGICPVTVFAAPGGRVLDTALGNLTEQQLRAHTERLLARSG